MHHENRPLGLERLKTAKPSGLPSVKPPSALPDRERSPEVRLYMLDKEKERYRREVEGLQTRLESLRERIARIEAEEARITGEKEAGASNPSAEAPAWKVRKLPY